ncbi:1326_t:CDS:10 [Funneliformis geosporum]|uniref:1326_t:CDS:1 n=1 Tax=Funneliformis geosporum TaxID=1117311 RepID=A0A9W4SD69_9GLOM|nr:1326_t:CDS:10 [Funneliformis geosporum]
MRPKSKKLTGLGKAIIKDRFKGNTRPRDGDNFLHTTDLDDGASWTKLQSITQQRDLDEFLSTAQLAGTQFTAEKEVLARQEANKEKLVIPRRPKWDQATTPSQLELNERDSFLRLQEQGEFLLTPFERNLEVWRQLWRVIERSDLVVQIVDARNPLFFRSTDLEKYVIEVDEKKKNLLLINKADLLTANQRQLWSDYLDSQGIRYIFFSAALAQEDLEKEQLNVSADNASEFKDNSDDEKENVEIYPHDNISKVLPVFGGNEDAKDDAIEHSKGSSLEDKHIVNQNEKICIRTTKDLISLLVAEAAEVEDQTEPDKKLTIGLVGYPNVGKSSTINALLGEKRVSVSSTPGKTKHFQTIHLSPSLILCDCPGLVFPNFATTNADMVCNGVLPIDQLRECTGPAALVAQRIPKSVLEAMYGIKIRIQETEEGGNSIPTAEELLVAFAIARGFTKSGHGNPDESRAARYILKDYVNGKLPYCTKSQALDQSFFDDQTPSPKIKGKFAGEFSRVKLYPIHSTLDDEGKPIDKGGSTSSSISANAQPDKKHKKGRKNVKNHGANGYNI